MRMQSIMQKSDPMCVPLWGNLRLISECAVVIDHGCFEQVVASSLVCLPPEDAGGAGPKVESWAFGTDREGLDVLARNRVFGVRTCKLCDDGVVVRLRDDRQCHQV